MPKATLAPLFGVPPLDQLLGHPAHGGTILIRNDPRIDGAAFLLQAAGHSLSLGIPVLYAVTGRAPERVRQGLKALGFASDSDGLLFLDAHSGTFRLGPAPAYSLHDPTDLDAFLSVLGTAAEDHPEAILCLDSLSGLGDAGGNGRIEAELPKLGRILHQFRNAIVLATQWPYSQSPAMERIFDVELDLSGVGDPIARHAAFTISRSAWKTHTDSRPHLYEVERPGGVLIHIPKIVIIGPGDAGKTSFVQSVSKAAVSADRLGTTVALDRGRYMGGGIVAELFGTPGQPRFDPLLEPLLDQAVGAVLLIHTIKSDDIQRAREVLARVRARGIRIIVAVTHQDQKGAPRPEDVLAAMPEIRDLPIVPCIATDAKSATNILESLIASIQTGGAAA